MQGVIANGYDGWYDHETRTIVTDERLSPARARTVLAHEIVHAEMSHRHTGSAWGELRQERVVDTIAARILIRLDELADALVGASDEYAVAEALEVDIDALRARIADLSPAEADYIEARHRAAVA